MKFLKLLLKNNEDDTALKNTVIDSNRIIGVQSLWDKGYKGQGREWLLLTQV